MTPLQPLLSHFLRDPSGAVTVDWVVLTASIVGLGLGAVTALRGGVGDLGSDVQASLAGAQIADLRLSTYTFRSMSYDIGGFWNNLAARENQVANASDAELAHWFANNGRQGFESALASGYDAVCENCWGAGNRLDLMRLILAETERRGTATPEMRDIVADAAARYDARFR